MNVNDSKFLQMCQPYKKNNYKGKNHRLGRLVKSCLRHDKKLYFSFFLQFFNVNVVRFVP
jgi:hypothetical protein